MLSFRELPTPETELPLSPNTGNRVSENSSSRQLLNRGNSSPTGSLKKV
jgi:hypothetical protein